MSIQERSEKYAKEIDDCGALLVKVGEDIAAGKSAAEIASSGGSLALFIEMLKDVDKTDDEFNADPRVALKTITGRVGEFVAVLFLKKKLPVQPLG